MTGIISRGTIVPPFDDRPIAIGEDASDLYNSLGKNSMKPALFSASTIVSTYQKSCDTLKAINKHLSSERLRFLNPIMLYGSDLFTIADEREMFGQVVRSLNIGQDVEPFLAILPVNVSERLESRSDHLSAEYCVILLNNPVEVLNLEHMEHMLKVQDKNSTYRSLGELDDFQINLFCVNTPDWIEAKLFNSNPILSNNIGRSEDFALWCRSNYAFLQRLQLEYYYPGRLHSFARTKGLDIAATILALYLLKDRIDMQYWNWNSDIWINLNLIGYNPVKAIGRYWRNLPNIVNPGAINSLTPQQLIKLWVSAMNMTHNKLTNRKTAACMHKLDWLYRFEDADAALGFIHRGRQSIESSSEMMFINESPEYPDKAILKLALEQMENFTINPFDEYHFNFDDVALGDIPAAIAAVYIPAFVNRSHSLKFSELTSWNKMKVGHPNAMNFICYLYKHRGWQSKAQPVHIGRGRNIDIHPHAGINFYTNNDWRELTYVQWQNNPSETFREGMEYAGRESSENVDGPDFTHFPAVVESVIIAHPQFFHIRNPFDLVAEGRTMGHCAGGSNYIRACARKDRVFFHYQPENKSQWHEGVTFDCDLDIELNSSKAFDLSSSNRLQNASPSQEERDAIRAFITELNKAWLIYVNEENAKTADQLAKAC